MFDETPDRLEYTNSVWFMDDNDVEKGFSFFSIMINSWSIIINNNKFEQNMSSVIISFEYDIVLFP